MRPLRKAQLTMQIWVAAAKWQLECNSSPEMARKLLQRGLLFNSKSFLLWHEDDGEAEDAVLKAKIPSLIYDAAVKSIPGIDFALSFLPICDAFDFADHLAERILEE
ncbi:hypothetical protein HPB49_007554 [Dermacentor silvarum]|uniref:Uncharacterized protein n=1 Tax=Dermacentor silvarum TaxID=543639 RepID=A0ACB8C7Y9_DERSI|nr:hypothetical protein HPB49_007554 [Dermacentor silvarum]